MLRDASTTCAIVIRTRQRQLQPRCQESPFAFLFFGVMFQFESASLGFPETWLTGYVVRCIGISVSWCGRRDSGTVLTTVLGMETKQRCAPEEVKVSRRPSHLQDLTWEDRGELADIKGWDGHNSDGSLSLSKVKA